MKKFDTIKDDITKNTDRFNGYQTDIEDKKTELEAQKLDVENLRNAKQHKETLQLEITQERLRLTKQIGTFENLKKALVQKNEM